MGGSTVTGVANTEPELLARVAYLCAYCCIKLPSVPAYALNPGDTGDLLSRARDVVWIGDPVRTGTSRTKPCTGGPEVLATQHALLMADLDRPAASYAMV